MLTGFYRINRKYLSNHHQIEQLVSGCANENRQSQKELYRLYYGFAYNICMRYCNVTDDVVEILNDGFLKVFRSIHLFVPKYDNPEVSLRSWIKSIMVHTAIDHFRKNKKEHLISDQDESLTEVVGPDNSVIDNMSYKEILALIQQLSPAYLTVFNLYVIDGYKHEEIAEKLKISVGASKSNLAKAKLNIRKMIKSQKINFYGLRAI